MESYLALKNENLMSFIGTCTWMELENFLLDELTLTKKDKYGMYSLINGY